MPHAFSEHCIWCARPFATDGMPCPSTESIREQSLRIAALPWRRSPSKPNGARLRPAAHYAKALRAFDCCVRSASVFQRQRDCHSGGLIAERTEHDRRKQTSRRTASTPCARPDRTPFTGPKLASPDHGTPVVYADKPPLRDRRRDRRGIRIHHSVPRGLHGLQCRADRRLARTQLRENRAAYRHHRTRREHCLVRA